MEFLKENIIETPTCCQLSNDHVQNEKERQICRDYGGKYYKKNNLWRFNKIILEMVKKNENVIKYEDKSTQTEPELVPSPYQFNPPNVFYDIIKEYI